MHSVLVIICECAASASGLAYCSLSYCGPRLTSSVESTGGNQSYGRRKAFPRRNSGAERGIVASPLSGDMSLMHYAVHKAWEVSTNFATDIQTALTLGRGAHFIPLKLRNHYTLGRVTNGFHLIPSSSSSSVPTSSACQPDSETFVVGLEPNNQNSR